MRVVVFVAAGGLSARTLSAGTLRQMAHNDTEAAEHPRCAAIREAKADNLAKLGDKPGYANNVLSHNRQLRELGCE